MTDTSAKAPAELTLEHGGIRLAALDWPGIEPAVVIVPGITSPAATWAFVVEALALPNRVIVLDVRGRGRSDAPAGAVYTLAHCASDLEGWIAHLELKEPILLGHSMGARIAARFDAQHPGVAGRVIAVDPPLSGPGREPYPFPLAFYIDGIQRTRAGMTLDELRQSVPTWSDERLHDRLHWLPTCSEHAVAESHRLFQEEDFLRDWHCVSASSHLIRGEDSPVVSAAALDELRALQPAGSYESVPTAAHMVPWDNLPGFVRAVRNIVLPTRLHPSITP